MIFELFRLIRDGGGLFSVLFMLGTFALLIFVVLPFHEFAHAYVAVKLGDPTPKWRKRLTLNPLAHLDPIGTLMMLVCGFGFAKPVPVNPANFERPKKGMAMTALAGPLSNLLLAFLAVAAFRLVGIPLGLKAEDGGLWATIPEYQGILAILRLVLIDVFASINIGLAVFNLLPIFPLDGSHILAPILPDKVNWWIERNQQLIMLGLIVLVMSPVLNAPLSWLIHLVGYVLCLPLGLPNLF